MRNLEQATPAPTAWIAESKFGRGKADCVLKLCDAGTDATSPCCESIASAGRTTGQVLLQSDVRDGRALLDFVHRAAQGDALKRLVSDVFALRQARSIEAECAIDTAEALMRGPAQQNPENLRETEAINRELRHLSAGHDSFWPR